MKQELGKVREEVLFHKYPEDLLEIRNKIISDPLNDSTTAAAAKEKIELKLPEGMKDLTESAIHVAKRLELHFNDLKNAISEKNDSLVNKIKSHVSQILTLVFRLCEFRMRNLSILEKAKLINICILTTNMVSKIAAYAGAS